MAIAVAPRVAVSAISTVTGVDADTSVGIGQLITGYKLQP